MPRTTAATGKTTDKPTGTKPASERKPRTRKPDAVQPTESTSGLDALDPMVKRHIKADEASLQLRIETLAHALIFDISSLRDVLSQLHTMAGQNDERGVLRRFFEYYVPRLETLLEEDFLLGKVTALSDLGEWHMIDPNFGFEFPHYATIVEMLKKPVELSPAQLGLLLERSAVIEREEMSRGEAWIPKSSRRASA